jgi:hypothetical protein
MIERKPAGRAWLANEGMAADEALEAARTMPLGPERNAALVSSPCGGQVRCDFCQARQTNPIRLKGIAMRSKESITYLSADDLEERAIARIREAEQLAPGAARQHALKNAAQLRSYAANDSSHQLP